MARRTTKTTSRKKPDETGLTENQKDFLKILSKKAGNVTEACKSYGIERSTHYDWVNGNEYYKKEFDNIRESLIDFAESKLLENINKCDTVATIFFLKTIGRNRGYIEKKEMELSGNKEQPIQINYIKPND